MAHLFPFPDLSIFFVFCYSYFRYMLIAPISTFQMYAYVHLVTLLKCLYKLVGHVLFLYSTFTFTFLRLLHVLFHFIFLLYDYIVIYTNYELFFSKMLKTPLFTRVLGCFQPCHTILIQCILWLFLWHTLWLFHF